MDVELVPAYSDRKLFLELAKDYIDTLHKFDSSIRWDEPTWHDAVWASSFIMQERTVQGFIVSEIVHYKVFPDMLYIGEFYVVPEERLKGIGIAAVETLVKDWHEDVFLYILHGNFAAKAFWGEVEHRLKWERTQRPEIRQENGCELRVYHVG